MCEHCLLAMVHSEYIEAVVVAIRLDGLVHDVDMYETEQCVCFFRMTHSPAYVPSRVRRYIMEDMLIRRDN